MLNPVVPEDAEISHESTGPESVHVSASQVNTLLDKGVAFPNLKKFRESNVKNFIFGHLNVNGLSSKFLEVHEMLVNEYINFLAICESKLYPELQMSFKVKDFTMYRQDRPNTCRINAGGGLVTYVSSVTPHRHRKDISFNQDGIEDMVFEVILSKEKWFFITMYRPPSVHINFLKSAIRYLYDRCIHESNYVVLLGDINVNFLQENNPLQEDLDLYALKNIVDGPTCFKSLSNPSLVDVILINNSRKIQSCLNVNLGVSDHHNITLAATKMHAYQTVKGAIHYNSYKHFNQTEYLKDLACAPFSTAVIFDDVDDQMWFHNKLLNIVINDHAPKKKRFIKKRQLPYMNGDLRRAINVKGMLRRKFNRVPSNEIRERYRRQRNYVTKLKRESLRIYLDEKCSGKKQPGQFWKTIKPFLGRDSRTTSEINLCENDNVITDPAQVCNIMNDYYVNVVETMCENEDIKMDPHRIEDLINNYSNHPSVRRIHAETSSSPNPFTFKKISINDLTTKLSKTNSKKSTGFDGIPPKMVKQGAPEIAKNLLPIINNSIASNTFPTCLKKANVTPVFKSGDRMSKEKYRPISVLPSLSKPFESILFEQIMDHFQTILSPYLAAYRKGYNTQHVLIKAVEDTRQSLDNGEHVGWVLMDLSKAFDALPHGLIIAKLHAYGLSLAACSLISDYLSSRKQRVKIGNHFSEWQSVDRGVPQGSVLGPLLFNIFKNDIFYLMTDKCTIYNYADDNTLGISKRHVVELEENLSAASEMAIEWFNQNRMRANAAKFQVAFFTRSNEINSITVKVNDEILCSQSSVKLLGLIIDDKLTFKQHVSSLCKKAAMQVNALSRLSNLLTEDLKYKIFTAFVVSNFLYCPAVWHLCSLSDTKKMERMQERALRFVLNDHESNYKKLLKKTKRPSLYMIRQQAIVLEIHKILNKFSPQFLHDLFKIKENEYDMRKKFVAELYPFKTIKFGKKSLKYHGTVLWNSLDNEQRILCNDLTTWKGPHCVCGECAQCLFGFKALTD